MAVRYVNSRGAQSGAQKRGPAFPTAAIPSLWTQHVRTLRGEPLVFHSALDPYRNRPFLPDILNDMAPVVVLQKARQIGATELFACSQALWFCSTMPGTWVVYTLPREDQVAEVSMLRVNPSIEDSAQLAGLCMSRKESRKVFRPAQSYHASLQSYMLFKSSWESALGEGSPADVLYYDEYDRMREGVEEAFREMVSASRLGLQRYLSTPSLPHRGIAAMYERSDQRSFLWKCDKCGHWQKLDWDANVKQTCGPKDLLQQIRFRNDLEIAPGTFALHCVRCERPINRMQAENAWVAARPDRDVHGYHISQLDAPWLSMDAIAGKLATTRLISSWRSYVLGMPWQGEGALLTEPEILACVNNTLPACPTSRPPTACWIAVGTDWGDLSWSALVTLPADNRRGGKPALLDVDWWSSKGEAAHTAVAGWERLVVRCNADIALADAGYGQDRNPLCRDRAPRAFWVCRYASTALATFEPKWNTQRLIREVEVGRDPSLKLMCEMIKYGMLEIAPLPDEKMRVLVSHLLALAPLREEDPKTGAVRDTIVRTGPDHLAHALNLALLGILRGRGALATLTHSGLDELEQIERQQKEQQSGIKKPQNPLAHELPQATLVTAFGGTVKLPPGARGPMTPLGY